MRIAERNPREEVRNGLDPVMTERRQAEDQLRRQTQRLQSLHSIDRGILRAESLEDIVRAALSGIRDLIPCHRATVWLTDLEAGQAVLMVADLNGGTHLTVGSRTRLDPNPILEDLRRGEPSSQTTCRASRSSPRRWRPCGRRDCAPS